MAPNSHIDSDSDGDSDYGYDFSVEEEQLLLQIASNNSHPPLVQSPPAHDVRLALHSVPVQTANVVKSSSRRPGAAKDVKTSLPPSGTLLGDKPGPRQSLPQSRALSPPVDLDQDVCYPDLSRALSEVSDATSRPAPHQRLGSEEPNPDDESPSPLKRFRSYPRKPLTVSDLTSGAWCELQYWYTLTRLPGGRKTRTKAMRQGSKVHKQLEDEVHTTVKIDITTKEDGFGLRLWNLVQGLRTMRDTGLTRELEVWGMVDGNLVNGIIDGVSHENPNPEFEEELSSQESLNDKRQSSLKDYFAPNKGKNANVRGPKVYLTDVKTRGSVAPVSKAMLRPAKIQLLLYHKFLSEMAAGKLDFLQVFRRYGLDPDQPFSDSFIAQIGGLHDEIFVDASQEDSTDASAAGYESDTCSSPGGPDLLNYRSLRELLPLIRDEMELAFPHGDESLGHMLRVLYVHRDDGRELDRHVFPVSRQALEAYLSGYMEWWRGERKAKGVDIEEAFKCGTCEFASDCSWRQSMDDGYVRKAQQRISSRRTTMSR